MKRVGGIRRSIDELSDRGTRCQKCGFHLFWRRKRRQARICKSCGAETSAFHGLAPFDSRISIKVWIKSLELYAKKPISTLGLAEELGVSYLTARRILKRFRRHVRAASARVIIDNGGYQAWVKRHFRNCISDNRSLYLAEYQWRVSRTEQQRTEFLNQALFRISSLRRRN